MGTRADPPFAVNRTESNDDRPVRINERWTTGEDAADIVFLGRYHPSEAEIASGANPVQFGAGDVALLDPHDTKCFRAIGRYAVFCAGFHDLPDQGIAMARRNTNLEGKFTRK